MTDILVIPDSHSKPGVSNRRFEWLGKYIDEWKPDVIVNIGDGADMESLCSYDKGTKGFEGRRYLKDVAASIDANERIQHYGGKAFKDARKVYCVGNHEYRIERATTYQAELEDVIGIGDLALESFGWDVIPFLEPLKINGCNFAHYFVSGIMGRAISGENPGRAMLLKHYETCIAGHNHVFDVSRRTTARGNPIWGMTVGCYFEHQEEYAGQANKMYWRGLVHPRRS